MLRVLANLFSRAQKDPRAPAVHEYAPLTAGERGTFSTYAWDYQSLASAVCSVAAQVAEQTPPRGVVLLSLPNGFGFTAGFLGTLAAGRTAFPVSMHLTEHELRQVVTRARVCAAMAEGVAESVLRTIPTVRWLDVAGSAVEAGDGEWLNPERASDAGMYLLSSGTTGLPKIVDRRGAALDAVAENVARAAGLTPDDVVLGIIPQCHSYGVENALLGPIYAGACLALCRGFDPRLVSDLLARGTVSVFPATPSLLDMLTRMDDRHRGVISSRLRCVYSAGAALPSGVVRGFRDRFGVPAGQLYGASEVGSVTFAEGWDGLAPTCVGTALSHVDIRMVDPAHAELHDVPRGTEGEVVIRAASMLSRYVEESQPGTTGGYWRSGDLGRIDVDGQVHITGRIKLLIDVGPEKVNPLEVEQVMREHPGVADCVVVPVGVTETIARLRAVVVPRNGVSMGAGGEELRHFLRQRLSAYKVPRIYEFRTELPRSPTGKVLRQGV